MLKIGLIGAGMIGGVHARAFTKSPRASLVAVADIRPEKAQAVAAFSGARPYATMSDLLAAETVDVVDICLPTPLHASHSLDVLRAGIHVFCEKPITRTMGEARRVVHAARAARGKFMVGHVVRFFPEYARAHELIAGGEVGRPGVIHTLRGGAFPQWSAGNWMGDLAQSGGVVLDLACHELDWLRWCFGEVTRVHARGLAFTHLAPHGDAIPKGTGSSTAGLPAGENRDHALILARFASGAMAHVEVTWALPPGAPFLTRVEVAGDRGLMAFDNRSSAPIEGYWNVPGGSTAIPESPLAADPYEIELERFLACIEEDGPPPVSAEDGTKALELSLAALESVRTGRPVMVGGAQ
jgi:UDP-N-acetylglucosamine 3-dehydrogenase